MTVEEMANKILNFVKNQSGVSFVELVRECGDEAEGDYQMTIPGHDNLVLWSGISEKFCEAYASVKDRLKTTGLDPFSAIFVYGYDGGMLRLPFLPDGISRMEDIDPQTEYWLPVTLSLKETEVVGA